MKLNRNFIFLKEEFISDLAEAMNWYSERGEKRNRIYTMMCMQFLNTFRISPKIFQWFKKLSAGSAWQVSLCYCLQNLSYRNFGVFIISYFQKFKEENQKKIISIKKPFWFSERLCFYAGCKPDYLSELDCKSRTNERIQRRLVCLRWFGGTRVEHPGLQSRDLLLLHLRLQRSRFCVIAFLLCNITVQLKRCSTKIVQVKRPDTVLSCLYLLKD